MSGLLQEDLSKYNITRLKEVCKQIGITQRATINGTLESKEAMISRIQISLRSSSE